MKLNALSNLYLEKSTAYLKIRTLILYKTLYQKHLESQFGNVEVEKIKEKELISFLKEKSEDLSSSSLKLILSLLSNLQAFAEKTNTLCVLTPNFKVRNNKKRIEAFSVSEQQKIERYILDNKKYYSYGVIISLYTGLRIGELLALKWNDVDFVKKAIYVNKTVFSATIKNKTKVFEDSPKTEASRRTIPLSQSLIKILKELKNYQQSKSEFVISKPTGKQIQVRVYQQSFSNLLKKLGIRHAGFHTLRHTFATRAVECGVDAKSLSEILGHSDIQTTLKCYVHSSFEQKKSLVNKLGKMLIC